MKLYIWIQGKSIPQIEHLLTSMLEKTRLSYVRTEPLAVMFSKGFAKHVYSIDRLSTLATDNYDVVSPFPNGTYNGAFAEVMSKTR